MFVLGCLFGNVVLRDSLTVKPFISVCELKVDQLQLTDNDTWKFLFRHHQKRRKHKKLFDSRREGVVMLRYSVLLQKADIQITISFITTYPPLVRQETRTLIDRDYDYDQASILIS
jgi:hypothetical protein